MILGILAAGEGERLQANGFDLPKPLLPVAGTSLIDRTLDRFLVHRFDSVCCIVNERSLAVRDHIKRRRDAIRISVHVESTPSSLHSLVALAPLLRAGSHRHFYLTMVDSIVRGSELADFIEGTCDDHRPDHATIAVTPFVDDEKPLRVRFDVGDRTITAIGSGCDRESWVTGGIYRFPVRSLELAEELVDRGRHRLREFQAALLDNGYSVSGFPFSKIVDVDRPHDIAEAVSTIEQFEDEEES